MLKRDKIKRGITLFVVTVLLVTSSHMAPIAEEERSIKNADGVTERVEAGSEEPAGKIEKNETVYVLAGADGTVKKIIVSDWIRNVNAAKTILDKSELHDILNVKGDETYSIDSDNMKVWNADGKDIFYRGTTEKSLPVDLKLTYRLDGKIVTPQELAGKSGKVSIRIDYTNNQTASVSIDGKEETMTVPFVMLSGMLLDGNRFSNVTVSNGRLLNDGDRIAVIGFALPGLQNNLQISKEELEFPDYVEINADVKDFRLSTVMTVATNGLFHDVDTGKWDSIVNIGDQIRQLGSGMKQLLDGSSELYGGLSQLLAKSKELIAGVENLYDGAQALQAGTKTLSDGLGTLVSHNAELNGGAKQVFDSLLSTVSGELTAKGITTETLTIDNYRSVLSALMKAPTDLQKQQLIALADAEITSQLSAAQVPDEMMNAVKVLLSDAIASGKTREEAMTQVKAMLENASVVKAVGANTAVTPDATVYSVLTGAGADNETAGLLAKLCAYLSSVNQNPAIANLDAAKKLAADASAVQSAATDPQAKPKCDDLCLALALETLRPTLEKAIAQLDSYSVFYQSLLEYTAGTKQAYDGSLALKDGTGTLADGIGKLKEGSGALVSGVQQLSNGAGKLSDGLKELDEKGIEKIVGYGERLTGILIRLKATIDLSESYNNFSGLPQDSDGEVKFIYKTDEIKVK